MVSRGKHTPAAKVVFLVQKQLPDGRWVEFVGGEFSKAAEARACLAEMRRTQGFQEYRVMRRTTTEEVLW